MKLQVTTKVQLEIYIVNIIPNFNLGYDDEHEDYLSKIIR
jgi:hypothetical protein